MNIIKAQTSALCTFMEPTVLKLEPVASECLKLIPLYWLYRLTSIPVHLTVIMILTSALFGYWSIGFAFDFVHRVVLWGTSAHNEHTALEALYSKVLKFVATKEEPIQATLWWIKQVVYGLYTVWVAWKGWHILLMVHESCKSPRSAQQTPPPPYRIDRSGPGPRLMVLEAASPVPDDLRPRSNTVFNSPAPLREQSSEDEVAWSPWGKSEQ